LETLIEGFLAQTAPDMGIKVACFGVAGPVVGGRATITNLPWVMSETQLAGALKVSTVHLLNDLVAIANAVPTLDAADLYTLAQGEPVEGGPIVVIAPGTGLGEAYLTWDGTRYRAHASEGGHTDFAPTNSLEIGLLQYLQKRFGHVSYERVCSGIGIPNIYAYLRDSGQVAEPAWLAETMVKVKDPTPIIVNNALDKKKATEICVATLDTFIAILAREAGNMALNILASGGVYLGGGIPPRILPLLRDGRFVDGFHRKGRFSQLLSKMPIHVVLNPKVALFGAASYGLNL